MATWLRDLVHICRGPIVKPIQIVIDTNVIVSAYRSRQGASFELLQRFHDGCYKLNLSNALVLEYEERLKIEAKRMGREMQMVDRFLSYLLKYSSRWSIPMSFPVAGIHVGDLAVFDLAVASKAEIIVTYNRRHFQGAFYFDIEVKTPGALIMLWRTGNDNGSDHDA